MPRVQRAGLPRELAHALVASAGPDGLPVLREALALAEPQERASAVAGARPRPVRARPLRGGVHRVGGGTVRTGNETPGWRGVSFLRLEIELATVAVLDLSLVRRFGGLDAIGARLPGSPVRAGSRARVIPPRTSGAADAGRARAAQLEVELAIGRRARSVARQAVRWARCDRALACPVRRCGRGSRSRVVPPRTARGSRRRRSRTGSDRVGLAAALVALQAAGRYERADAEWSGVAERRAPPGSSTRCGWRSRCGRWCGCGWVGWRMSRPICAG